MIWIPGGTFRMGSNKHYSEEAPVHRVAVSGFWIDRTPVTNQQFKQFVRATGHKTLAEIPPDPKKYPGASPHMLYAGSLVFTPPHRPVDLKNFGEWWYFKNFEQGSQWARKAVEHLKYNMGSSLISSIVADMIHDGPREKYANGGPCVDGLIVGSVTELADQIKYYRGEMLRVA